MDKIKLAYYFCRYKYWDIRSRRTKDQVLFKGYNAMYLAWLGKYKAIKYRPKG